jgi:hypothetical protein
MVGEAGVVRALRHLAQLQRRHGFQVLVTVHRQLPSFLRTACEEFGFELLPIKPMVDLYQEQHGIKAYLGSELTISANDPHPSSLQHHLHADAIHALLLYKSELLGLGGGSN